MGWAEEEFETLDLGDTRLNRRAVLLAERIARQEALTLGQIARKVPVHPPPD